MAVNLTMPLEVMREHSADPEWKAAALADLLAIADYIPDDTLGAAQALNHEIEEKSSCLRLADDAGPVLIEAVAPVLPGARFEVSPRHTG